MARPRPNRRRARRETSERKGGIRRLLTTLTIGLLLTTPATAHAGWTRTQLHVYQAIRNVFPKRYVQARRVFWCESRYDPWAQNGQYVGVPQLSAAWRAYFLHFGLDTSGGHWHAQLVAAHLIFRGSHYTWRQWECQPY